MDSLKALVLTISQIVWFGVQLVAGLICSVVLAPLIGGILAFGSLPILKEDEEKKESGERNKIFLDSAQFFGLIIWALAMFIGAIAFLVVVTTLEMISPSTPIVFHYCFWVFCFNASSAILWGAWVLYSKNLTKVREKRGDQIVMTCAGVKTAKEVWENKSQNQELMTKAEKILDRVLKAHEENYYSSDYEDWIRQDLYIAYKYHCDRAQECEAVEFMQWIRTTSFSGDGHHWHGRFFKDLRSLGIS